ncbi:MAG TPA: class II aldolase/adducin family protein [Dongiaceae bacterium]|nr:class II aldolase/adducin family protein [Dongiaceae bacterium]
MSRDSLSAGNRKNERQHRQEICLAGRWLYERGYIVACEGNLSVRLNDGRILTTPTCMNKGMLDPRDLVLVDQDGRHLAGSKSASSEVMMHLLFYRMRPDVHAICHAHPATATGFAAAGRALDQALLPEVVTGLGQIPLVRYATPGTPELSAAIEPYVEHYDALLLANHGAVTCGPDLMTAFFRMETVEHTARITLAAENAGTPKLFSSKEVAKLMSARSRYGVQPPPGGGAELPLTSDEDENVTDEITLRRDELDALIDDAVRKDRARRTTP